MKLFDAHCHVRDEQSNAVTYVVNGTSPSDWSEVIALAKTDARIIPAIGLHPWEVDEAPEDWQARFSEALPDAGAIGEIGLDRWIEGYDIERQEAAFCWQLAKAAERDLPVSIHCLKAGDALLRILKRDTLPARGVHLHAYSGSAEQVAPLAKLGAYFSFHAGQFAGKAKKAPAAVRAVPADRLLIETDAPNTLDESTDASRFLVHGYEVVAELRGVSINELTEQVAANFKRYFQE